MRCVLLGSLKQPILEKVEVKKPTPLFSKGQPVRVDHAGAKPDPWPELDGMVGKVIGSAGFEHGHHASFVMFDNGEEHKILDRYLRPAEP